MKSKSILILCALSLAVNAALAYALTRPSVPAANASLTMPKQEQPKKTAITNLATPSDTTPATTTLPPQDQLWTKLSSSDLTKLVANLRAAGFSAKTIRAIIQSLINEKYAERLMIARGYDKDTPYWKTSNVYYGGGDKRMKESNRIHREMNKEVRAVLGDDYTHIFSDDSLPHLQRQYGNLSSEKFSKLMQIQTDYGEMMSDLHMSSNLLPADKEKRKLLEKEHQVDIAKLLTPDELFEYQLRNSTAASRLRGWNDSFDLTESEFRGLFPLYNKLEEQFSTEDGPNDNKARQSAEEQLQDQIKAILGEARYADFKQSRDPSAFQENRLVLRLGLPLSTATQLMRTKNEAEKQMRALGSNKELSPEQKQEQLSTLKQKNETKVRELLGERGLTLYRNYGGHWMGRN